MDWRDQLPRPLVPKPDTLASAQERALLFNLADLVWRHVKTDVAGYEECRVAIRALGWRPPPGPWRANAATYDIERL